MYYKKTGEEAKYTISPDEFYSSNEQLDYLKVSSNLDGFCLKELLQKNNGDALESVTIFFTNCYCVKSEKKMKEVYEESLKEEKPIIPLKICHLEKSEKSGGKSEERGGVSVKQFNESEEKSKSINDKIFETITKPKKIIEFLNHTVWTTIWGIFVTILTYPFTFAITMGPIPDVEVLKEMKKKIEKRIKEIEKTTLSEENAEQKMINLNFLIQDRDEVESDNMWYLKKAKRPKEFYDFLNKEIENFLKRKKMK